MRHSTEGTSQWYPLQAPPNLPNSLTHRPPLTPRSPRLAHSPVRHTLALSAIVDIPPGDVLPLPLPPHETLPLPPPPVGRAPPTGRTTSASWIVKHLQLIQSAISSITVGQFEDRVYAILMHTPPGAKLIPLADNTGLDPPPLAPPTRVTTDDDDDTLRGMAQTTLPHTNQILKAMDRHILNGDMLKARRSSKYRRGVHLIEASQPLPLATG